MYEIVNKKKIDEIKKSTEPISTKLGTKHPWLKGIQVCSNKGPCPFPRGCWLKNCENISRIFWRTTCQFQPNLAQSILFWRGFNFIQMKGHVLFQGEVIRGEKYIDKILKIFSSKTTRPISTKLGTNILWWRGLKV